MLINFYDNFKSIKRINPNYKKHKIEIPARIIVACGSGHGKSNLVLNILYLMNKTFSDIIICTKAEEPLYDYLQSKIKDVKIYYNGEIPDFEKIPDPYNGLVIFDDLVLDKVKQIGEMFIRGRKDGWSSIYISQNFYMIEKTIRVNSDYIFLGKGMMQRDLNMILSEMAVPIKKEQLNKLYSELTRKNMNFMLIDLFQKQIRHNITDTVLEF